MIGRTVGVSRLVSLSNSTAHLYIQVGRSILNHISLWKLTSGVRIPIAKVRINPGPSGSEGPNLTSRSRSGSDNNANAIGFHTTRCKTEMGTLLDPPVGCRRAFAYSPGSWSLSRPAIVAIASSTFGSVRSVKNRTEPSAKPQFEPFGWFPPNCPPTP